MVEARSLNRFVQAQAGVYPTALAELQAGHKRSHWMWYIFPQIEGLGLSVTAQLYAIADGNEARAYLDHELLGPRLREATKAMLDHAGELTPVQVLGPIDALKFNSCMTLFEAVAEEPELFAEALDRLCDGRRDTATLERL